MKIYNEVVIDMNPESSSYGETLHEDSYEYNGEMMTAMAWTDPIDIHIDNAGNRFTLRRNTFWNGGGAKEWQVFVWRPGSPSSELFHSSHTNYQHAQGAQNAAMTFVNAGEGNQGINVSPVVGEGGYTYQGGEFAPTMGQFQESIETTGGYGELEAGFGLETGELGEFDDKPLEFMKKGLELETKQAGLQAGESLYTTKQEADVQKAQSGLAYSGSIVSQQERKQKGIMADYKQQQEQLALGYEEGVSDFWKSAYEEMYGDVGIYEEAID